jgi:hypothetical protein
MGAVFERNARSRSLSSPASIRDHHPRERREVPVTITENRQFQLARIRQNGRAAAAIEVLAASSSTAVPRWATQWRTRR